MTGVSVSVIVPTRDRPVLLEAALRSLLLQTRSVDQIVVVDDGSTSTQHLAALQTLSPVIEIVRHGETRGVAAARNTGLAHVRGTHLFFLDDDDLVHPRFVEDGLLILAGRPETDVVVFLYECIYTPRSLGEEYPVALLFDYERLPVHPLHFADSGNQVSRIDLESRPVSAFLRFLIPIHSCLLRRSAVGNTRFPESLTQGEDTYFWISLAAAGRGSPRGHQKPSSMISRELSPQEPWLSSRRGPVPFRARAPRSRFSSSSRTGTKAKRSPMPEGS